MNDFQMYEEGRKESEELSEDRLSKSMKILVNGKELPSDIEYGNMTITAYYNEGDDLKSILHTKMVDFFLIELKDKVWHDAKSEIEFIQKVIETLIKG